MTSPASLTDIPENPCPEGAEAFWFAGYDGRQLRGAVWPATADAPRGTVLLFSGRTEFIEKYFEVVTRLRERGYAVATMDWRGQGLSARMTGNRLKGHIDDFSAYDRDLACFLKLIGDRKMPAPYVGLAHSMGGNILLRWLYLQDTGAALARGLPRLERLVLSAPMVDIALKPWMKGLMRGLGFSGMALGLGDAYLPGGGDKDAVGSHAFEGNSVTSDPQRYARQVALVEANPNLALASVTCGWAGAASESMDWVQSDQFARAITTPVLFAGAEKDVLVPDQGVAAQARRMRTGQYLKCVGCKHEILMERDDLQAPFWSAFDAFLTPQTA